MLSLVLYGRNDNHGYNLHKRAAISLNAMAEVLSDTDDEILFVDYNTPDDLPTFPEAIGDTLTDRAKDKLRILRVRPVLHEQFRSRTHLNALESISRNIATRRSNPNNRWVLSTNTDMIFVPHNAQESLSDIVRDLPDAFYQLPRMELPEVLWESFDRRDGAAMVARTREWAKRFHLNEIVKGSDDILFDGPGDFQLCLRRDLFEMNGFHEGMLRGWHVDANLCVRMLKRHGRIEGLTHKLFAYHCDHTRQATPSHTHDRLENSADEFIAQVREAALPAQAETWGLPDAKIEEVRLGRDDVFSRYLKGLETAIPAAQSAVYESAYRADSFGRLGYRRAHVLPFVMDLVAPFPRTSKIFYAGARADMFEDFVRAHAAIADDAPILVPDTATWLPDLPKVLRMPAAEAVRAADLLIFEFGVAEEEAPIGADTRQRLSLVRRAFVVSAAEEQKRVDAGGSRRRVVAINAIHNEFEAVVSNHVAFTLTPYASRVRHGYYLLDTAPTELGFDVRAVWRDVAKTLGRTRPIPLVEGDELARLAAQAAAAPAGSPLSTEAIGCAEPLAALLRHPRVEQAAGVPAAAARALAERLELARPSRRARGLLRPSRAGAPVALTRVADSSDWEQAAFARLAANHFGGASAYGFTERNLWTWERTAALDALGAVGALSPDANALLVSTVPDLLAPALADYVGSVTLAEVSMSRDGPMIIGARDDGSPLSAGFARFDPSGSELYDVVVVIQHALFAQESERFAKGLAEVGRRLKAGGHVVVSADVSIAGLASLQEISGPRLARGDVARGLAGSGLSLCGPVDARITAPTADRAHPHRRADLKHRELISVRGGGRIVTEGIVTLRRERGPIVPGKLQRALLGSFLQRLPGLALRSAKRGVLRALNYVLSRPRYAGIIRRIETRPGQSLAALPLWRGAPQEWSKGLASHGHVTVREGRYVVAAGAADGHALFGPYLPLDSGRWTLRFRARALEGAGALSVDVAQSEVVISEQSFPTEVLDGRQQSVTFTTISNTLYRLARNATLLEVQTRFSVFGGAGVEIWDITLAPADDAGDVSAAPRQQQQAPALAG